MREVLIENTQGKIFYRKVTDPLGRKIKAAFGVLGDKKTAVVEMADASGLHLLNDSERRPLETTTYGTGELIDSAIKMGCRRIIVGLGGSATVDGGVGLAQALGAKFLDKDGREVAFGGGSLNRIKFIDLGGLKKKIRGVEFIAAADVTNPLIGKDGAAYVYAPQKGATKKEVRELENNLTVFFRLVKNKIKKDVFYLKGAGAAGGLGAGLVAFLNARLTSGIDVVLSFSQASEKVKNADLVITGEGKLDRQTVFGKAPYGVLKLAKRFKVPVIAIGGIVEDLELLHKEGFAAIFSIVNGPMNKQESIRDAAALIKLKVKEIISVYKLAGNKR
jgi:glycerate kinase